MLCINSTTTLFYNSKECNIILQVYNKHGTRTDPIYYSNDDRTDYKGGERLDSRQTNAHITQRHSVHQ